MENQHVSYEVAQKLKELGFDLPCYSCYDEEGNLHQFGVSKSPILANFNDHSVSSMRLTTAPTRDMVCEWLRVKHGFFIEVRFNVHFKYKYSVVKVNGACKGDCIAVGAYYGSPNEAVDDAIQLIVLKSVRFWTKEGQENARENDVQP